jgi:hypothetical protein
MAPGHVSNSRALEIVGELLWCLLLQKPLLEVEEPKAKIVEVTEPGTVSLEWAGFRPRILWAQHLCF